VSRDGTLWIGTEKGLASWKDGKLTQYAELAGRYISRLLEDHEGSVWASGGGDSDGKALRDSEWQRTPALETTAVLAGAVFGLYEDSKGNLWAGVTNGLWRWKPGPPRFYRCQTNRTASRGFGEGDDGALLNRHGQRNQTICRWKMKLSPSRHRPTVRRPEKSSAIAMAVCGSELRSGALWHVHQGRTDVFAPLNGLSGGAVYTLL